LDWIPRQCDRCRCPSPVLVVGDERSDKPVRKIIAESSPRQSVRAVSSFRKSAGRRARAVEDVPPSALGESFTVCATAPPLRIACSVCVVGYDPSLRAQASAAICTR
jgi:hypothetical protein